MSFDPLGDLEDLATSAVSEFESAATSGLDAIESTVVLLLEGAEDVFAWTEEQVNAAIDALGDVAESLDEVLDDALAALADLGSGFGDLLDDMASVIAESWRAFTDAIEDAAAWVLETLSDIGDFLLNRLLPMAWGFIKLAVVGYILVTAGLALVFGGMLWWLLPAAALAILICTANKREWGEGYGTVVRDIVAGTPQMGHEYRIARLPAVGKYFITSDHHRYQAGKLDAFNAQGNARLYRGMLEFYAVGGWTLIENGDMEDFWLRGGSARGVMYDIASTMPAPIADAVYLDGAAHAAVRGLLAETIRNPLNAPVYATVKALFHDHDRYHRIAGNHDGAYQFDDVVEVLQRVYPGMRMNDVIVLEENEPPTTAIVTHGHKTDAWSSDSCSFIGETFVSLSSAMRDMTMQSFSAGVPDRDKTLKMWNENRTDEMMGPPAFNETLGAAFDSDFSTMNEAALFDAVRKAYPAGDWPYLLLAHTHGPLIEPGDPRTHDRWFRYYNDGTGLFWHMITGLEWEWDGLTPQPTVRLVAWRYDDDDAPTQILRREFLALSRWYAADSEDMVLLGSAPEAFTPSHWTDGP